MSDFEDDLFSEGSNDSFFEDPKSKSTKNVPKKTTLEKKDVSKIFGLEESQKENVREKTNPDWLGVISSEEEIKKPESINSLKKKMTKKVSFEDDILDTIGLENPEKKHQISESKGSTSLASLNDKDKKKALLDDIFGIKSQNKENPVEENFKDTSSKTVSVSHKPSINFGSTNYKENAKSVTVLHRPPSSFGSSKSEEFTTEKNPESSSSFSANIFTREGRRTKSNSYLQAADPLGFLSLSESRDNISEKELDKNPEPHRNAKVSKQISWLDDKEKNQKDNKIPLDLNPTNKIPMINEDYLRKELEEGSKGSEISLGKLSANSSEISPPNTSNLLQEVLLQKLNNNPQNASLVLQQQEYMLMVALQMKKYEENLQQIQMKQQEMLTKQEDHFKQILEDQILKQHTADTNLQVQQEKFNKHLEMLLVSSRPLVTKNNHEEKAKDLDEIKELEEKQESKIVTLLKEKQHEERFLLEESYKKQIFMLEENLRTVEERLKLEIERNSKYNQEAIVNLNQHHKEEIEKYRNKIEEISIEHKTELQNLKESHSRIIEDIKTEYAELLNSFKHVKQLEKNAFENTTTYVKKLDENLDILTSNASSINEIKSKLEEEYNILSKAREETLKAKGKEIEMMKESLEKTQQTNDMERSQLMALVGNLELKLVEQSQNAREDRWSFQQATSSLVAKMAAFDREVEFERSALEREREQLKTLKENLLAEQEKVMLQLTEEKLAITAEKSRLETSSKLANNYDLEKGRIEVDAAVKTAREAAAKTNLERENLLKAQYELETCKRELQDREHVLTLKEKFVESMQKEQETRAIEAERSLEQAKLIESTYANRMKEMHVHLESLTKREKRLAEEKLNLSKERLKFQMDLQQLSKCTFCTSTLKMDFLQIAPQQIEVTNFNVSNPEIERLPDEFYQETARSITVEGRTED